MKKIYSIPIRKSFLLVFFLICSATAFSQKKVSGKVTDGENSSALPGATVQVKGTNRGVTANAEGSYSLEVSSDAVLIFSSLGYTAKEITVGNQSIINISLAQDAKALSEVVVTGYGTQRKKDITGAVTVVGAKELTALPAASVTQMLQGRAAGVTVGNDNSPGGGTMVRIRGFGSINNNSPLYVIDGVPTQGTLNQINPNDIESMQVLKDASAASIYGARAANGVVIITTKRGGTGEAKITFDA